MKNKRFTMTVLLLTVCSVFAQAETIYFLVARADPNYRTDSYVLPLTSPWSIAHARDLIQYGTAAGQSIAVAHIACGADNINRNFHSPSKGAWSWHVTESLGFVDIVLTDGSPDLVNKDCYAWIQSSGNGNTIGFSTYTVVAELGRNPKTWQCNLNSDQAVNMADMTIMSQYWDSYPCADPSWCGKADINHDGFVDLADLELFADTWLTAYPGWPIWYSAWACAYQCHGDADCLAQGGRRVTINDANIFLIVYNTARPWPALCGQRVYDPRADFDRDCDVDDVDGDILNAWLNRTGVPADCATTPY